MLPNVRQFLTG